MEEKPFANRGSQRSTVRESLELPATCLALYRTASLVTPPDGGLDAWLQVLSSFLVFFNTWGIVNTFGVFQTFYKNDALSDQSNSAISWIGSVQAAMLVLLLLITGPLFDRGYCRVLMFTGSFLIVLGMMMVSFCKTYWQFMLAQGVCMGLGNGVCFITGVAIVPTYFSSRRGVAAGIAASGSSFGGVMYPIVFQHLQPRIGFSWTTRVMGFIMLTTMGTTISVTRLRQLPMRPRPFIDWDAFRMRSFSIYGASQFLAFAGSFIPFFYIQHYAGEMTDTSTVLSFYTLSMMNAGSMFGRIIPGLVADRIGTMNTLLISGFITVILVFSWVAITSTAGILIFSILYGFGSGGFVALQSPTVAHLCPEVDLVGTWLGMIAFLSGLGMLIGNPISGAILAHGSWTGLQCFSGAFTMIGIVLILGARWAKSGSRLMFKS